MSPKTKTRSAARQLRDEMLAENCTEAAGEISEHVLRTFAENLGKASEVHRALHAQFKGWEDVPDEQCWTSLGALCRELDCAPQMIRAICHAGNIKPVRIVDGTPFFAGADSYTICGVIRGLRRREREQNQQAEEAHA